MKRLSIAIVAGLCLAACGDSVGGTYVGGSDAMFEKIALDSGKADVTIFGSTREGRYTVDGKKLVITIGSDSQVFEIDDKGCLKGGRMVGTYCPS